MLTLLECFFKIIERWQRIQLKSKHQSNGMASYRLESVLMRPGGLGICGGACQGGISTVANTFEVLLSGIPEFFVVAVGLAVMSLLTVQRC